MKPLTERYDVSTVHNQSEERVYIRVEKALEEHPEVCRCSTCVLDLVAFMLNRVTPRYSTGLLGELHPRKLLERKMGLEIELSLKAGMERLRRHPHHESGSTAGA